MAKLKPWPVDSVDHYQVIAQRRIRLEAIITTCLQEGCRERNKELLRRLNRLVYMRAREIQNAANSIATLLPANQGRPPKWFTVTLDISAAAMSIIELAGEIDQALKTNEFIYIESLLKCAAGKLRRIEALLNQHPNQCLEVWREAVEEIRDL